jgi:hypothetical protein
MQTLPLKGHAGDGQPNRTAARRSHLERGQAAAGGAHLLTNPQIIESPQGVGQQAISTSLRLWPARPLDQQNPEAQAAQVNSCGTSGRAGPCNYDISMHVQTIPVDNVVSSGSILHSLPGTFQVRRCSSRHLSEGLEFSS